MKLCASFTCSALALGVLVAAACGGRSEHSPRASEDRDHEPEQGGAANEAAGSAGSSAGLQEGAEPGHAGSQARDPDRGAGGDGGTGASGVLEGGSVGVDESTVIVCPEGQTVRVSRPACGDGVRDSDESCDDGNGISGDGCSIRCTVERGWICPEPGLRCTPCGNALLDAGEECDDGNTESGDGCAEDCALEPGYRCTPETGCFWVGRCGDGSLSVMSEQCDDGNTEDGDGCSADCSTIELGYVCRVPHQPCERVMESYPHCGDGIVQPEYDETCDTGNDDGCTAICRTPECGDGIVQPEYGEACDDGMNDGAYLGCTADCTLPPITSSVPLGSSCGDGIVQPEFEECDDGTNDGIEGRCSADCTYGDREGYCGDGILESEFEECDDGNSISCDGCSSACLREEDA